MVQVNIRSRRRAVGKQGHPALTCLPSGEITANVFGPATLLQQWEFKPHQEEETIGEPTMYTYATFKSHHGLYLSATQEGAVYAKAPKVGSAEKWLLYKHSGSAVSIRSVKYGKYLTSDGRFDCGTKVKADRKSVVDWSKWFVVKGREAMTLNKTPTVNKLVTRSALVGAVALPLVGVPVGVASVTVAQRAITYGSPRAYMILRVNEEFGECFWVPDKLIRDPKAKAAMEEAIKQTMTQHRKEMSSSSGSQQMIPTGCTQPTTNALPTGGAIAVPSEHYKGHPYIFMVSRE